MIPLSVFYLIGLALGDTVLTSPNSIRLQVAKNGSFDVTSTDGVNEYFIYTEHEDRVINITCSTGSLATHDCLLRWNLTGSFPLQALSISQEYVKFNTTGNATWSATRVQVIKSEGLWVFNQV